MTIRERRWQLSLLLAFVVFLLTINGQTRAQVELTNRAPELPSKAADQPFSPSNAQTEDGKYIATEAFFPAARCASCHQDTHRAWLQSLHRNAAREPFYRESVDILLRTRGIEPTRHCESCHTPVALFSGALTKANANQQAPFTPLDDEGVTCTVCHSIVEARPDGTGSYTIRRPALLAREDGALIFGNFTDAEILADVPAHKRAVMRPLLRRPEFCSVCHKVSAPPTLNGYKQIRGFSAYDEWQQSGASLETVTPFYRREQRTDCRACHMPKIESQNDRAAKNGMIASHRWLGANTAAPLFYGQAEQAQLIQEFLQKSVLNVDLFALKSEASGMAIAPLPAEGHLAVKPGEEIAVEVVVANRNAAHSFPPEVRDLYEAWVEFEATDETGTTIFHSGALGPDGGLDESAHVYKTLILDQAGRPITRHQIWLTNIKAYDNTINAGRSDVARYRFRMPSAEDGNHAVKQIRLTAQVNYRRFNQDYIGYVLNQRQAHLTIPVVAMAKSVTTLTVNTEDQKTLGVNVTATASQSPAPNPSEARRWNDYGIGLLEQAQYGPAAEAFRQAHRCDPANPDLLVNAAIAEMRTERFGPERQQINKAAMLIDEALKIAPSHPRALYWHALVLRSQQHPAEAAEVLERLAAQYPRDCEVLRQWGQTLYGLGRLVPAGAAFEAVIAIDPQDAGAYQFLSPIYLSEGRKADAEHARALYYEWRDDPRADGIASRFYAAHPEWAEERIAAHSHNKNSAGRPVLSGSLAAPDR